MRRCFSIAVVAIASGALVQADTEPSETLYVSGADTAVSVTDGTYMLDKTEVHNKKLCYKKEGTALWLCYDDHNLWSFQPEGFLGTSQGIMVSTQKTSESPVGAGPWRVWKDGTWSVTSAVVRDSPAAKPAAQTWTPPLPVDEEASRIIAGMLLGFMALTFLIMVLAGSTDEQVRAYFYKMFSACFTFLIALLFAFAVWELLIYQILPAPRPRGFGLALPIHPELKIVLSFLLFSLSNFLLNFIGWKVQFRRARLMVVKTLGAHVTAIFGTLTFLHIQRHAVFESAMFIQGTILSPEQIRGVTAFLIVAVAWITFAVYRWASKGARKEMFGKPPLWPWGAPLKPLSDERPAERSCMSFGSGAFVALAGPKGPVFPDWGILVDEAEDEGAIVVMGFLTSQAIMFCRTGEMPVLRGHFTHADDDRAIPFFAGTMTALIALFAVILYVRSLRGDPGRSGKICQRATAMSLAWMLYRAIVWNTRAAFTENAPLALVIGALAITMMFCIIIVVMDRCLDILLNRSNSPFKHLSARMETDTPLSEKAMRAVNSCFGLIMALGWWRNMEVSVQTVVASQQFLASHEVMSQCFLCALLAVALVFPWRRVILPKSEMKSPVFAEEIKFELIRLTDADNFMP